MQLTPKQERFVAEYLITLNATQAAIAAGYSEKTAESQGSRLLTNVKVAAALASGKARQLEKAELSAERVLEELRRLAFVDPRAFFDPATGKLKHPKDLDVETAAALQSFDVVIANVAAGDGVMDTIHKVKWSDKTRALEMLAKHFLLLVEQVRDVSGDEQLVSRLAAARQRLQARKAAAPAPASVPGDPADDE